MKKQTTNQQKASKRVSATIKKANVIPIVFITDANYALPTYIAIFSLKHNKDKDTKYRVHVLETGITDKYKKLLKQLSSNDFIIDIRQHTADYSAFQKENFHVSVAAIIKFYLPHIFNNLDKILYIDSDVIINRDLSPLFQTNIENKYAAAVKDMIADVDFKPSQQKKLKINNKFYFNSGVMLLNLKKLREDDITQKLVEYRQTGLNIFMDQDALNVCFKENVKYLDLKYNCMITTMNKYSERQLSAYYNSNISYTLPNTAFIVHFTAPIKPWHCRGLAAEEIWHKYYKLSKLSKEPLPSAPLPYYLMATREQSNLPMVSVQNATNPIKYQSIIISLTSFPERIDTVNQTIESLLNQKIPADKVILWLAPEQFPNKEKDLPQDLLDLCHRGLTIEWHPNLRSYTKLIPTLKKYPDSVIITADDDIIYKQDWLQLLLLSYAKEPNVIHCHRAHKICFDADDNLLPYQHWEWQSKQSGDSYNNFLTGVGGVLYPPHCLHKDVLNEKKFKKLCPLADDIWFWAMAVHNGTKIKII